jgi:RNA polymerase sigma-70 factor (ECF subfamily)
MTTLLLEAKGADQPETFALAALMCLQAARLPGRTDAEGELTSLLDQDRSRWDSGLIRQGLAYLDRSASGPEVTAYHVEAAIASAHVTAPSLAATNWPAIVSLYDRLMSIAPSPVVALSRAIAIGERDGPADGLAAIDAIADRARLEAYPFYPAAIGELERRLGHAEVAREWFGRAASLARNPGERRFFQRRAKNSA